MTPAERAASEAQRLLNEPLLAEALDTMLSEAFAEFKALRIATETMTDVIALQQRINVIQAIPDMIARNITASGRYDGGVDVEEQPTA